MTPLQMRWWRARSRLNVPLPNEAMSALWLRGHLQWLDTLAYAWMRNILCGLFVPPARADIIWTVPCFRYNATIFVNG